MLEDPTADPGFEPPHCPNPKCHYHKCFRGSRPYLRKGTYQRRTVPKSVRRFQCRHCGRNFSSQTFSITYWQKRPELSWRVFMGVTGCMGDRQIARKLRVSPQTVCRHIARLARHCLLFHRTQLRGLSPLGPIVIDGFRSFEFSQYRPFEHQLAVEAETDFWLYHVDTELRRSGRMTEFQRRRRAELEAQNGRPPAKALGQDIAELLRTSLAGCQNAVIRSDEHAGYRRPIAALGIEVRHDVTHSKRPRTTRNPLFAVNLLDLLIRHSQSNHKRETIAFSKRRQASAERLSILLVWRNYIKHRREKSPGQTPAMFKGITSRPLLVEDIVQKRLFPAHLELPQRWELYYRREISTREIRNNQTHRLRYAF